jgi:hypothetical protein
LGPIPNPQSPIPIIFIYHDLIHELYYVILLNILLKVK